MSNTLLEIKNLTVSVEKAGMRTAIVKGVDIKVPQGKIVGLVGESGCGKSMTAKTINGILPTAAKVTEGAVLWHGNPNTETDLARLSEEKLRKLCGSQIGMVFQESRLFPWLSVQKNISFGITDKEVSKKEKKRRVSEMIKLVGLTGFERALPKQLSGGMQRRVALARAMAIRPSILVMDDTTSAVDSETEQSIQNELRHLPFPCTKFIIAQRISSMRDADLILVLEDGRITECGTHEELIRRKGYYHQTYVLQCGLKGTEEATAYGA